MSVLDPLHPIHGGILECLAKWPNLDMEELHKELGKIRVSVSLPNLYRTVSQMIDVQMLVRSKGKVSLHGAWIAHLQSFADTVSASQHDAEKEASFALAEGERREYVAQSLAQLDPVWFHVLIQCAETEKDHDWYAYNSHPWHVIGMNETELNGYRAIAAKGISCRMVYGNDDFLTRYALKLIKVPRFRASVQPKAALPKDGYAVWVCGEYVVECLFPESLTKRFRYFFNVATSLEEFEPELFADVFKMKARVKLTLRRNKKDADGIRMLLKKSV